MSEADDIQELNSAINSRDDVDYEQDIQDNAGEMSVEAIVADDETRTGREKMWAIFGDAYSPCDKAIGKLPPGQYTIKYNNNVGLHFLRHRISLDELIHLPDSVSEEIINGIEDFWNKEEHFRKFKFLWKRGVLLFGPAGSGKTSTLQILSKKIIERGGLAVYIDDPGLGHGGLEMLRRIEPTRPLVVMVEDIDAVIRDYGESSLLALFDGELQIDNVVYVATTNYPEKLDKRLVNRPSRFDVVRKIDMPSSDARKMYLEIKNPRLQESPEELAEWVEVTKGFSIAHLKELVISVEVLENDFHTSVKRLQAMMDHHPTSEEPNESFGFIKE